MTHNTCWPIEVSWIVFRRLGNLCDLETIVCVPDLPSEKNAWHFCRETKK